MGHAWSSVSSTVKAQLGLPAQQMQVTWECPKAVENAKVRSLGIQTTPGLWTVMENMHTTPSDHGPSLDIANGKRKCSGALDDFSAVLQRKKVKSLVSEEDHYSRKFASGHYIDSQCWSNKVEEPFSKQCYQSSAIEDDNFQLSEETRKARDIDSLNAMKAKSQLGTSKDLGVIIDNVYFRKGVLEYFNGSKALDTVHVRDNGNKVLDLGTGKLMLGAHISKRFGDGTFKLGRVISYDESLKLYKVQYTDKTIELLEWLDLEPILLYEQQNGSIMCQKNTDTISPSRWPKQRSLNQLIVRNKRSKRHRKKVKNMHYTA